MTCIWIYLDWRQLILTKSQIHLQKYNPKLARNLPHALLLPADAQYSTTLHLFSEHVTIFYIHMFQILTHKSRPPAAIVLQPRS